MSGERPEPPPEPVASPAAPDASPAEPGEASGPAKQETRRIPRIRPADFVQQYNQLREERQGKLAPPVQVIAPMGGPKVPPGIELAAQWAWRFLVIAAAGWVIANALGRLEVVVVPVVIALLISALTVPIVGFLQRFHLGRGLASVLVVVLVLGVIAAMLTFAGSQVANGASDLADQTAKGLGEIKNWLKTGPLHASDSQINTYLDKIQTAVSNWGAKGDVLGKVGKVGSALTDVLAGLFIVLFSTFFFLFEGDRIWAWIVRLSPRAARARVDSSGRVAWVSLTQFVRATVIVALVDAIGIMIVAAILRVPLVAAIGVLVFLGAFVPLIGATVAGSVAVLVALVDKGPLTALLMLAGVVIVQQLEAHGLQPFLLGRWVSVHPLAVIVAIATGVLIAGIPGALVAVPLAATVNAVVLHLTGGPDAEEVADDAPTTEP